MARKKEYSLEDASAKKHKSPNFNKPIESNYKQENQNWQSKTAKHKDQNTNASCSRGAGKVYDVGPLRAQLNCYGLTIRDIPGDGNCLFRALGDQLEGHSMNHLKHRIETVHYMIAHRHHFEPFIDVPFERYVENLSRPGTYAGQDALVAFARLHKVNIVIHQLNSPLWHIEGADNSDNNDSIELHLSYHNGEHYSSVRRSGDIDNTPPHIRIVSQITGSTEVPCCTSTQTICTSTSPIQSHVKFSNTTTHKHPKQVNYLSSSTINSSQPSIHHHNNDTINRINDVRSSFMHNEDDEFSILLEEVMLRSGCKDAVLATEAFIDNNGDVDQTVDYLLSLAIIIEPMDKKSATITSHSDSVIDRQQKQRCHRISADPCGDLDVNVHNEDRMGVPLRFVNRRQSSRSRTAIQQNSRTVRSSVGRQEKLTPRNANTNSNKSSRSKSRLNTTANRTTSNNRMREETTAASDWETSLEGDIRFLTL